MELGIEQVINLIVTAGVTTVISALVIIFLAKFGNIGAEYLRGKVGIKKHDELVERRNSVSAEIQHLIERFVLQTHGDRVYVFEFHNGQESLSGLPFLKMTNTYEALGPGVRSEMHKREGMPFLLFQSFVDAIYAKEFVVMETAARSETFKPLVYEILEERDIALTLRCKISDLSRRVIGYLGIDWCTGTEMTRERAESYVSALLEAATKIGALLSVDDKKREAGGNGAKA